MKELFENVWPGSIEFLLIGLVVGLALRTGPAARTGDAELFVLDMGAPVRIVDLAQDLIALSGFKLSWDTPANASYRPSWPERLGSTFWRVLGVAAACV